MVSAVTGMCTRVFRKDHLFADVTAANSASTLWQLEIFSTQPLRYMKMCPAQSLTHSRFSLLFSE